MLVLVKLCGHRGVNLPELMFWRQLIPGLVLFIWLLRRGEIGRLKTARPWVHARRAATGTLNLFLMMWAVQLLPLAESTVLTFTMPVFAVLLATVFLDERATAWHWGAVCLGVLGVALIASPTGGHLPLVGVCVGLGAAFGGAIVSIQLRDLGRTEEPVRVVFYFSLLGCLLLAPWLFRGAGGHDAVTWALIIGVGLSGLLAQLFMTSALRYGGVASVIVMDYSQLIWSTCGGWVVFSQLPPGSTWVGAPLIIAAGLLIAWNERLFSAFRAGLGNLGSRTSSDR
ncbi:MAG: DMT family transporter [Bosea sp.]|nr:DMT family transporter [Bosea sp. (in: a-proteobacteria)]